MTPDIERRHPAGASSAWAERHRLDLWSADAGLAVSFQVAIRPNWGKASFLAAVLEQGQHPVVIADSDVPIPDAGWEIRTSGLWADHVCETPLDHWSYGLEAFALAVDDPEELLGRAVGDRVPLGWELEFEASDPVNLTADSAGYDQAGTAHGILLSADGQREIEGTAVRCHSWGTGRPLEVMVGQPSLASTTVVLPDADVHWRYSLGASGLTVKPELAS